MRRLRTVAAVLVAVSVVAAVLYVGLLLRRPVERPLAYWAMDDRTLGVVVLDAPDLSCEIARVDESSDAVSIHAQCSERVIAVPQTGMAQKYVLQATLQAPLGGRPVYDGSGTLAERCQAPGQDCIAPG
jgi:hypothetical protein